MKSLKQLEQNCTKAQERYWKKDHALQDQIATLEGQRKAMKFPHLLDYLEQLAKKCIPLIKGAISAETLGPFGVGCECSIHFKNNKGKVIASATFTHLGKGFGLKDYSKKLNVAPKGSISDMNGGNFRTLPITEKMTVEWFVKFASKQ